MESDTPSPPVVNEFAKKSRRLTGRFSTLANGDKRTVQAFLRILGYVDGCFRKSHRKIHYYVWNAPRFSKKSHTQGKAGYSVRSLERIFPRFQRWCTEYEFEKRNIGGRWCILIWPNASVMRGVSGKDVRSRLVAAIRSHVAKGGRCHVDWEFLRKFSEISLLSLNLIESTWGNLAPRDFSVEPAAGEPALAPLKGRWRGVGRGRKFVVHDAAREAQICAERKMPAGRKFGGSPGQNLTSDPQSLPPVSISYGNEKIKTSAARPQFPEDRLFAALTPGAASVAPPGRLPSEHPPPDAFESPGTLPYSHRSPAGCEPLQFCGRFISWRKLLAFAVWLAVARLKFAHLYRGGVVWRFAHARNFALRCLKFGYAVGAIEAAYVEGVQRSHNDAVASDPIARDDGGFPLFKHPREPSAAVVYAWRYLRANDPRDPEQLWAAFFAKPARERPAAAGKSSRSKERAAPPAARARFTAAEAAARLVELRATVRKVEDKSRDEWPVGLTAGELVAFLKTRFSTLGEFAALPWRERVAIVRQAARWKAQNG